MVQSRHEPPPIPILSKKESLVVATEIVGKLEGLSKKDIAFFLQIITNILEISREGN